MKTLLGGVWRALTLQPHKWRNSCEFEVLTFVFFFHWGTKRFFVCLFFFFFLLEVFQWPGDVFNQKLIRGCLRNSFYSSGVSRTSCWYLTTVANKGQMCADTCWSWRLRVRLFYFAVLLITTNQTYCRRQQSKKKKEKTPSVTGETFCFSFNLKLATDVLFSIIWDLDCCCCCCGHRSLITIRISCSFNALLFFVCFF